MVLTGRSEFVRLDRRTGEVLARDAVPRPLAGTSGRAWLHGPYVLVTVPGTTGDLGQVHDAATGGHLADVAQDAYGLTRTGPGDRLVLAPGFAITLIATDQGARAAPTLGPSRARTR